MEGEGAGEGAGWGEGEGEGMGEGWVMSSTRRWTARTSRYLLLPTAHGLLPTSWKSSEAAPSFKKGLP